METEQESKDKEIELENVRKRLNDLTLDHQRLVEESNQTRERLESQLASVQCELAKAIMAARRAERKANQQVVERKAQVLDCPSTPCWKKILMLSAMLMDAYRDEQPAIHMAYRFDGHLNSRRMQASTRVSTTKVHDLLFADDCTLNTLTEEDMQMSMELFAAGCANFGLTINTAIKVVMRQPPHSVEYKPGSLITSISAASTEY
ncbi:unnamed protein product [Schistocephalus solidus]|uniref:Reverse transcriptase domain-containing protein n=1 Tax=Schistocephalus solidus TaxID=70667 RepID=A0A183TMQ0_SCHSO|nr:unnamed protein product [Schistocephalus solidus]